MNAKSMIVAVGTSALATFAQGAEVTWTGGSGGIAYQWVAGGWETGELPGVEDTAVFVDIPRFRSQVENGTAQSITLIDNENQQLSGIAFRNLYGIVIQGKADFTLGSIVADDIHPTTEDIIAVATNKIALTGNSRIITLTGESSTIHVGENHVLEIGTMISNAGAAIEKTGPGLWLSSGYSITADTLWIKEGHVLRTANSYPSMNCGRFVVGGAGKSASVEFSDDTVAQKVVKATPMEVRAGGTIKIDAGATAYQETVVIDHGTFDAPGYFISLSNDANTENAPKFTICGGTYIADLQWPWATTFEILAAEVPSVFRGTLDTLSSQPFDVPDGTAAVDFVLDGVLSGGNRQYGKSGAGTMLFIDRNPANLYGIGRDFNVSGGTFILQSETEIGLGTNNIAVAAGATLGGTGHQVGGIDPANEIRGLRGNVNLTGAIGNPATLAPGTVNYETGAFIPGTFTIGSAAQTNNVTLAGSCVLRIGATKDGVSSLVVNGLLTLSGDTTLEIVGPENSLLLQPGTYEIVKTKEPMTAEFASVAYNGGALPTNLKVRKVSNTLITLRVAPKGMFIVVR